VVSGHGRSNSITTQTQQRYQDAGAATVYRLLAAHEAMDAMMTTWPRLAIGGGVF
jgi:hypothetical protein